MKKQIHPQLRDVVFFDETSQTQFIIKSTVTTHQEITLENGITYPLVKVETSSASHPFYTGKQKDFTRDGRIQQFKAKYGELYE